ncbi:MAG: NADAR family protein [Enterobacteriaceae bacterium]|jgi:ribA/ribD-fused uncharacterized protein|nr:NADAR family protein [Enterobacteriaceae bacterium]
MKYNLKQFIEDYEKESSINYVFFWGHQKSKHGDLTPACFSQWWSAPFIVDEVKYNTAEHWMMAQKALLFGDMDIYNKVLLATSPADAKSLGRQISHFDEKIWSEKCFEIVVLGNLYKFSQNENIKTFLLNTENKILVEASPLDKIWGVGMAADDDKIENPKCWRGLNLLGFALMEVRDRLKVMT